MDWGQIVLILSASIVGGILAGIVLYYLIRQLQRGIKLGNGLLPINLLTWALISVIIFFPSNATRIVLAILFLIFFPGYALMAALFTKKEGIGGIERVVLSCVLSIALVSLVGFILNYTPWGIRLEPILYSVASFILITSIIAWLRRSRLPEGERFATEFKVIMPGLGERLRDKVITITLVVGILVSLGILGYVIAMPKAGETFTDFYILGQEGEAANYPTELNVGEEGRVIMGIINHEGKDVSYRVELIIGGKKGAEVGPVVLADEQKWEGVVNFVPEVVGENQKIEFLLYRDSELEPYLEPLHLWLDVR